MSDAGAAARGRRVAQGSGLADAHAGQWLGAVADTAVREEEEEEEREGRGT